MYVIYELLPFDNGWFCTFVNSDITYPSNLSCNDSVWLIPDSQEND